MKHSCRCIVALVALVTCPAASHEIPSAKEIDISVSSAVAKTLATITGRARARATSRSHKLGLSRVKSQITNHIGAKKTVELFKKEEAPKQLSGYLGWSHQANKEAYSTAWKKTRQGQLAKNVYMHDLEQGRPKEVAGAPVQHHKQALVVGKAVTTAFSKMLEEQMSEEQWGAVQWGSKAKLGQTRTQARGVKTNSYLDAVGWTAPAVVKAEDNEYIRTLNEDPNKKMFLAAMATKVVETHDNAPKNKYFSDLMPKYFDVEA